MIKLVFVNESCQNSLFFIKVSENSSLSEYINKPRSEKVKSERVLAYGALSYILSKLYKIENFSVDFSTKPKLRGVDNAPAFNISHTNGAVVVAITDEYGSIGVDIEGVMSSARADKITKRFLDKKDANSDTSKNLSLKETGTAKKPCPATSSINETSGSVLDKTELLILYLDGDELKLKKAESIYEASGGIEDNISTIAKKNKRNGIDGANVCLVAETNKNDAVEYLATERYTLLEAALKCEGGGFASLKRYEEIISECAHSSVWVSIAAQEYSLSLCCR